MTAAVPGNELMLQDVTCARGDRVLFEGFQLRLEAGGLAHVQGSNGSGKTSLLRMVCGLLPPAGGEILWNGRKPRDLGDEFNAALAYVGHQNAIQDQLRIHECLKIAARLAGLSPTESDIHGAVGTFGLQRSADLACRYLSQGQKRRVALARLALSGARPLWVLDEPFAALDASAIEVARTLVERHLNSGGMVVLTTHQEISISATDVQRIVLGR